MSRATSVHYDHAAIRHNLNRVRTIAPNTQIMAMVKANAYGHGIISVAKALNGVDKLGVASIDEALALREAGVLTPIVLMEGFFEPTELPLIEQHALEVVIHHANQLDILEHERVVQPLTVWLKVDTGMHRLGFLPQHFLDIWQRAVACESIKNQPHLMTHFSDADLKNDEKTERQTQLFFQLTQGLSVVRSMANSAAILSMPNTHQDVIRPGLMLYGVSPFHDQTGPDFDLAPVMTLMSELIAIHDLKKGDTVGYGSTWECPEDMRVGVVAIGYGDGYPYHASQGTPILINDRRVPLVGRVSMDMISVDLRTQPEACVGDTAILWGKGLPVEHIAQCAKTIPYELLCGIAKRVKQYDEFNIN